MLHSVKWLLLAVSCRRHLTTALRLPESSQRVPGDKLILWNNILESATLPFQFSGTWSKILLTSHSTGYSYRISNTNKKNCAARQRANSGSNSGELTPSLSPQKAVCLCLQDGECCRTDLLWHACVRGASGCSDLAVPPVEQSSLSASHTCISLIPPPSTYGQASSQ